MRGRYRKDEVRKRARFLRTENQAVLAKEVITTFLGLK